MEAHIVLSDAAQIDSAGKVGLLGAGWTVTGPNVPPMAVTVFLRLPWEEAGQRLAFRLRLLDDEDQPVLRPGSDAQPVEFSGRLALDEKRARPDDETRLVDIQVPISVTIHLPTLRGGHRYRWVFDIEGKELAATSFVVRRGSASK
jgi:hypothetical protein